MYFCVHLKQILLGRAIVILFFFFNDTATTEIYTLSLHDALPICARSRPTFPRPCTGPCRWPGRRSEEHTSELQSHSDLVCRLLLEKKKHHNNPPKDKHQKQTKRQSYTKKSKH